MHKYAKALFTLILILMVNVGTAGCEPDQPREITAVLGLKQAEITKVILRSGNTGAAVTAGSEAEVREFLELMEGNLLTKAADQSLRSGYLYAADMYTGDQQAAVILFGGELVKVDDTYYDLSEEIGPPTLDRLFESLSRR